MRIPTPRCLSSRIRPAAACSRSPNGQADFTATATGTEVRLANEGQSPYTAPLKGKFSYVMQLYDNQFIHFLMTKEWADANGVRSWADIAKKKPKMRLAINRPDNPQTTIGGPYEVMKAYGFSINDIEKWGGSFVLGNSQIGLDAITDGKADVFMNARNLNDSLVKEIASKRDLLWIDGDRATIQKAADTFSNKADMVPKGTYPFMEKDYPTVRMWVALLAGSHVSDEVVYKYVKAVAENEARVQDDRRLAEELRSPRRRWRPIPPTCRTTPARCAITRKRGWLSSLLELPTEKGAGTAPAAPGRS